MASTEWKSTVCVTTMEDDVGTAPTTKYSTRRTTIQTLNMSKYWAHQWNDRYTSKQSIPLYQYSTRQVKIRPKVLSLYQWSSFSTDF